MKIVVPVTEVRTLEPRTNRFRRMFKPLVVCVTNINSEIDLETINKKEKGKREKKKKEDSTSECESRSDLTSPR